VRGPEFKPQCHKKKNEGERQGKDYRCMPIIVALGRQEDHKFQVGLGYTERPYLKTKKNKGEGVELLLSGIPLA
jgi:hypothetical protein